jgi:DNA-binding NarL/FixJ family response regulator
MRVVLVGSASERVRLRAALANTSVEVVGEAPTAAGAQRFEADALLLASDRHRSADVRGHTDPADDLDLAYREPLTPREVEVLELLAEGLPNKAIAGRLAISDQTVKFHVSSICGKLGAANRTEAVRRAFRQGLIVL